MYIFFVFMVLNFIMFYFHSDVFMKILINMEFTLITLMLYYMFSFTGPMFYMIYILIFGVCEGVIGLCIMVLFMRFYGSDLVIFVNLFSYD